MSRKTEAGRQACNKYAHNNKQWVRISRAKNGDCTWCPPNGGENTRGHHSNWGKKRAIRRYYTQGKCRKQWFNFTQSDRWMRYSPQFYDKGIYENLYTVKPKKG